MSAQRFLPLVQVLGRGFVTNRPEIFQQGAKVYNAQNFQNNGYYNVNHCSNQTLLCAQTHEWRQNFQCLASAQVKSKSITQSELQAKCLSVITEFKDRENEHAHSVLRALPAYDATTTTRNNVEPNHFDTKISTVSFDTFNQIDYSKLNSNDIALTFINLSQHCLFYKMDLENENYSSLCQSLVSCLPHLHDHLLLSVLKSLSLWPPTATTTTPNFMLVWNALDQMTTERIQSWNIDTLFLVADHWYALRLSRISKYNTEVVNILGKKILSMSPSQLVQYLFYANLARQLSPFVVMKDLEKQLVKAMNFISIDELGVIAMGFFKTQTFPKNLILLESILKKTKSNLHCVSDPSLGAILKLLRRTIPVSHWSEMLSLMDSLSPHVEHLNHMCLLQIALLGNDLLVFHPEVISKITQRFAQNIHDIRLKDLERLTFVLMLYNFVPPGQPDILNIITTELRRSERKEEILQYPRCFVSCVVYMVNMGHIPYDLVSNALHPSILKLLQTTVNYTNIDREISELDWAIEIEGSPDYKGSRINPSFRSKLTKKYLGSIPTENNCKTHQEKLTTEVRDKLSAMLGGDEFIAPMFILPYNQIPDLVFCTNTNGEPVPLPYDYLSKPQESLKTIENFSYLNWNAVVVGGRNSFIRNSAFLRGTIHTKKRQLNKLGYNVAVLPFMNFSKKNLITKLKCLERMLQNETSLNVENRVDASYKILQNKKEIQ